MGEILHLFDPLVPGLGHKSSWVHCVSQVMETGTDGFAFRNDAGDERRHKSVEQISAHCRYKSYKKTEPLSSPDFTGP